MAALDAAKRADQLKDDANRSLHEDRPQEALSLYTKATMRTRCLSGNAEPAFALKWVMLWICGLINLTLPSKT